MRSVFKPVLSGICLLSAASYSYAENDVALDDMTVTGIRSQQSTLEQAVSIGRKSADEVKLDNAVTQKELLNSIAGVRINQTGSTIGHMASVRLPTSTKPYYLYLQDSIPVQSSGFFNHNALAFTNFSSAGSAEVLKGAGTALYGSDAIGATFNILSPSPMDQLGAKFSAEIGPDKFQRYGASGGIEIDDYSAISASVSTARGDGWRDNSKFERDELSINYVNDLNDDNSLKLSLNVNRTEAEMTSDIRGFRNYRDNPKFVGDNSQRTIDAGVDPVRKFDHARLSAEWNHTLLDKVELNTIAYVRSNRNRYNATWLRDVPKNDSKENSVGLLFKADIDLGTMRVISGVDVEYTQASREYSQEIPSVATVPVPQGAIFDYDINYRALAPYTRLEFQLTKKLKLGTGLRYDINQFDYTNNLADGLVANSYFRPSSSEDRTFNHLSPKIDLTYQVNEMQTIYGRYANGFRVPQATTLYSLDEDSLTTSFDEETTNTFEIGYKLKTDMHEFSTAVYYLTIDDTIISRTDINGDSFNDNGGKTLHKGVELSLASKFTNELTSKIAISHSKHEFDGNDDFGNNEQEVAPENIANVRLIYTPQRVSGLMAMVEWEHVGSYWLDNANTTRYAGHDVANLKMRYQLNKQITLFGRVNNLTDRLYAERATKAFGSERYTPAAPRQAFFGIEYKL